MIEANVNDSIEINYIKYFFKFIASLITIVAVVFVVYALKLGLFDDKTILVNYIKSVGIWAPIIFIILQIFQVIIPVIPGGISCLAGVLAFGPVLGFIYNFIGLMIGSCMAYYISKRYGVTLIRKIFKEETINKYLGYINNNSFKKIFFVGIILPIFPDDLLCYIAGVSTINFKSFISINLVGKIVSLLGYSLFMNLLQSSILSISLSHIL